VVGLREGLAKTIAWQRNLIQRRAAA